MNPSQRRTDTDSEAWRLPPVPEAPTHGLLSHGAAPAQRGCPVLQADVGLVLTSPGSLQVPLSPDPPSWGGGINRIVAQGQMVSWTHPFVCDEVLRDDLTGSAPL